jgi:NTP pyrophosphatase (non-canonical NTP hydrolase)
VNLDTLQREAREWRRENFPEESRTAPLQALGVCEEAGELAHCILKMEQGIRGSRDYHRLNAADAVGDIIIYLTGLCDNLGLSLSACVQDAWIQVKQRDWVENPDDGA